MISKLAVAAAACACVACGTQQADPVPVAYDENMYAAAVCVDRDWVRVPDNFCPIGDAEFPDHPYQWVYDEYSATEIDIDIVYLGFPVDRTRYIDRVPQRVGTTHIDRGRFPARPLPGSTPSTSVKLPSAPVARAQSSGVTRGGLGAPSARATTAPRPNRDLNSPAPGRVVPPAPSRAPARAGSAPAPRAVPQAPAGARPMSPPRAPSGSTVRSGRK